MTFGQFCFGFFCSLLVTPLCAAQVSAQTPLYRDPSQPIEKRVDDLVSRMTLDEKVSQMMNGAAAIDRLGVPAYNWWNECLHGVARAGRATVFPQAIGLAATWDTGLMHRVATVISDEARAKHHESLRRGDRGIYQGLTFWSPNINIFRDPRWGRGMETYGEDPFLTGAMGVAFIRGLQGDDPKYLKLVATAKHYAVHSGPESERHTFDALIGDRDFLETYLPHFRMAIEQGKAYSVMGAYNRFRGLPCCASPYLLDDILRKKWGFDGYVVSDCGAIYDIYHNHKVAASPEEAAALAVKAGTDLNCGEMYGHLVDAVKQGIIKESEIDVSVKRLFTARFKLGMFDPPEIVPYAAIPYEIVDSPKHRQIALETARASMVLLKNEGNLLPLDRNAGTVAVIGPNADDVEVLLGNYNGIPVDPVTPLRGIREKIGASRVYYAFGCEWAANLPNFEAIPSSALRTTVNGVKTQGLLGEYFDNAELSGAPKMIRVDSAVDFIWWDSAPSKEFDPDNFGVRWSGEIVPTISGRYALGAYGQTGYRLYFEDKLLIRYENPHEPRTEYEYVDLVAGKAYPVRLEYYEREGESSAKLVWSLSGRDYKREALEAAKKADTVVLVMGLSPRLEGEEMKVKVDGFSGGDRIRIDLPDVQEDLIESVAALGKPTVLVLLNGSAVAVNWAAQHIPAIVEAWYPGQAAGTALADVLFGDYNPAGRLPVTFYTSPDQLPPFNEYAMKGRTYRYFEGKPLFPFGHGLSYTTFAYDNLKMPKETDPASRVVVTVDVTNTGKRQGEEVVQLYVTDVEA